MALSDTIAEIKKLTDLVEQNPGKLTDVLADGEEAAQQMATLLGNLKSGNTAAVRQALTEWDDVDELLADSAAMDVEIAKGPGITLDEVLADTGKVLGVAAKFGGLVLQFGPMFGI